MIPSYLFKYSVKRNSLIAQLNTVLMTVIITTQLKKLTVLMTVITTTVISTDMPIAIMLPPQLSEVKIF